MPLKAKQKFRPRQKARRTCLVITLFNIHIKIVHPQFFQVTPFKVIEKLDNQEKSRITIKTINSKFKIYIYIINIEIFMKNKVCSETQQLSQNLVNYIKYLKRKK